MALLEVYINCKELIVYILAVELLVEIDQESRKFNLELMF